MNSLATNVSSFCPAAFSGVSGQLFAATIAAVITAHCAIIDDHKWPDDKAEDIINGKVDLTYDFIIVGAGTAGSLLAGRLIESNPSWKILVVEAGNDPGIETQVPSLLVLNQNTEIDWGYKTDPDGKSCLEFKNKSCIWSKGKAIGGSNAINAMLYIRGHKKDFDGWSDKGNSGWAFSDVEPLFDKFEESFKMQTNHVNKYPLYNVISKAWSELGFGMHQSDEGNIGTKISKLLIQDGKRIQTAKIYLNNPNLHVMKDALAQKVILNSINNAVQSLQIKHKSGAIVEIKTRKEIILSAGSIGTPQILLLSGVGNEDSLKENGIKSLVNLPVGKNLQDHLFFPLFLKVNLGFTMDTNMLQMFLMQYMLTKTGPLSDIGITDFMGFIDTKNQSDYPDIQFHHVIFPAKDDLLKFYLDGIGYRNSIVQFIQSINNDNGIFGIFPTLLHPRSIGNVTLVDSHIESPPMINTNYLNHPEDVQTLLRAIRFVQKLGKTKSFTELGMEIVDMQLKSCIIFIFDSDEYWECYVRNMATTVYHPVGTAKMGPATDPTAVVGDQLLVHGVDNLRIVDASIMPTITGGNTMAPTLMIAEKAANLIIKKYDGRDEL